MTSMANLNVVSSVYAVVLAKDGANPLQPESDEEAAGPAAAPKPPTPTGPVPSSPAPSAPAGRLRSADLEGIDQRILALPLPARDYIDLQAGMPNSFSLRSRPRRPRRHLLVRLRLRSQLLRPTSDAICGRVRDRRRDSSGDKLLISGPGE